jgi:5'(3')-deoxyribonucleotidase
MTKTFYTIALDIDDVCLDLMETWLWMYNHDFDDHLKREQIIDWSISNFVKPVAKIAIYQYIEKPDVFDMSEPIDGALESVEKLRSLGHRIIFVTANNPKNIKYTWLCRYGFLTDNKDFVQAYDKSLIIADYLVDDRYDNVVSFNGQGVLINQPWNQQYDYPYRVKDIAEFIMAEGF